MEKGKQILAAADDHAPWIKAIQAQELRDLSSGWTCSPSMEKAQSEKGKQVEEADDHALWIQAIAAQERRDLSSGWTRSPYMEKVEAEKGKQVAAAEEEEDHVPCIAAIAAQESGVGSAASYRGAVPTAVEPKQKFLTDAQIRRKKKKNKKTRLRAERKANGEKIWSPADVETFDESDSDDTDELSDDVADDDEDRDRKSRAVLKKLKDGFIPYLTEAGEYKYPWCFHREMPKDYLGMLQHATYFGSGSVKHQAHLKAKHAAYGVFLLKHLLK